jgi:hypothetical protein
MEALAYAKSFITLDPGRVHLRHQLQHPGETSDMPSIVYTIIQGGIECLASPNAPVSLLK